MAYTDRLYDSFGRPKKRSAKDDLLKDVEDTFYGGGTAPAPTPTPTPTPTTLAMVGQPSGVLGNRQNAAQGVIDDLDISSVFPTAAIPNTGASPAGRTAQYALKYGQLDARGVTQVKLPSGGFAGYRTASKPFAMPNNNPSSPSVPTPNSYYVDRSGTNLGSQYGKTGSVNPLPRGAVGIQGSTNATGFNRSLNGSQPTVPSISNSSRPMTPAELAADMIGQNLNTSGSLFGTTNLDNTPQQVSSGQPASSTQETLHFLPPGFTAAVGSTGVPGSTENDIHFLPPGFSSVTGTVGPNKQLQVSPNQQQTIPPQVIQGIRNDENRNIGYGSAYSY